MTQPAMFARTVQQTNIWLKELQAEMGTQNDAAIYAALRAVLHQLRDRLTVEEAAQFAAQLPTLMRGIFFESWNPARTPESYRSREAFLAGVSQKLSAHPDLDPELASMAVFTVISRHVSVGEVEEVRNMLPAPVQELWPGYAA